VWSPFLEVSKYPHTPKYQKMFKIAMKVDIFDLFWWLLQSQVL
jgi:hypothetical protein